MFSMHTFGALAGVLAGLGSGPIINGFLPVPNPDAMSSQNQQEKRPIVLPHMDGKTATVVFMKQTGRVRQERGRIEIVEGGKRILVHNDETKRWRTIPVEYVRRVTLE